jgi:hypothetical protein
MGRYPNLRRGEVLFCPELFVVIAARDFEGWKTDFNICA